MTWPRTPLRTYAPGIAIEAADLNEFQRAINATAHGEITEAHPLDRRLITSGTWAVDTTTAAPGSTAESVNARQCLLVFKPPPVGSVIVGAGMKVKDGGGTSRLTMELYARTVGETGSTVLGSVETTGTGAITTLDVVSPFPPMAYTVVKGERLFAALITSGGGAAERRVYELYLTYYRP